MPRKKAASSPLPAPAPVKRARKRIKTVKLTGDPFSAIRKAAGIEKAKRTRKGRAVAKRAVKLRNDPAFMAELKSRQPLARKVGNRERRMVGGGKKATHYSYHKIYRRALAQPEIYGPKLRKKKSA